MLAKVQSCAVVGLDAEPITVEVDLASGLEKVTLVGLLPRALRRRGNLFPYQIQSMRRAV